MAANRISILYSNQLSLICDVLKEIRVLHEIHESGLEDSSTQLLKKLRKFKTGYLRPKRAYKCACV